MSASPSTSDIRLTVQHVGFGPISDIALEMKEAANCGGITFADFGATALDPHKALRSTD
jgi:hypothetical protein